MLTKENPNWVRAKIVAKNKPGLEYKNKSQNFDHLKDRVWYSCKLTKIWPKLINLSNLYCHFA